MPDARCSALLCWSPAWRQAIDPGRQPLPAVYPAAETEEAGATLARETIKFLSHWSTRATTEGARADVSIDVPDEPVLRGAVRQEGAGNPVQPAADGSARAHERASAHEEPTARPDTVGSVGSSVGSRGDVDALVSVIDGIDFDHVA